MESGKDQTQSSVLLGDPCSRNAPVHLDSPLPRGGHQLEGALPRSLNLSSTLSSAKTIYSQEKEELCLIAVMTCRDGLLMYLDTEQFASMLHR